MKTSSASVLLGLACAAGLFGAPSARAGGSQIRFSGAVVAPTCTVSTETAAADFSVAHLARTSSCGQGAEGTRTFTSVVTPAGAQASDPLLGYFAAYVSASGTGRAVSVMTRTYE